MKEWEAKRCQNNCLDSFFFPPLKVHFDCSVSDWVWGHQLGGYCNAKMRDNEKDNAALGRVVIVRLHLLHKYGLGKSL